MLDPKELKELQLSKLTSFTPGPSARTGVLILRRMSEEKRLKLDCSLAKPRTDKRGPLTAFNAPEICLAIGTTPSIESK